MKGTLVYVRWTDSSSRRGWLHIQEFLEEPADALLCVTMGFLIHEDDGAITVACSLAFHGGPDAEPDGANALITIPKCAILGLWEVSGIH